MVNKKTTLAKKIRQSKVIDYKLAGWSNVKIGELLSVTPSMDFDNIRRIGGMSLRTVMQ